MRRLRRHIDYAIFRHAIDIFLFFSRCCYFIDFLHAYAATLRAAISPCCRAAIAAADYAAAAYAALMPLPRWRVDMAPFRRCRYAAMPLCF